MKKCQSVVEISRELFSTLSHGYEDSLEITIFLCGGGKRDEIALRREISNILESKISKYRYRVFLAEDMFAELIYGHEQMDLLTLEGLLADGVHCVAVLLQSPGTFTELGAFAHNPKLQDKLVVVVEPRFRGSRSFIIQGPIRFLDKKTKSKISWQKMELDKSPELAQAIGDCAHKTAKHSSQQMDLSNPLTSTDFFLALVYVLDPVSRKELLQLSLGMAGSAPSGPAKAYITATINYLIKRKHMSGADKLSITDHGIRVLIQQGRTKAGAQRLTSYLSDLRIQALNQKLRRKKRKEWGVAARS